MRRPEEVQGPGQKGHRAQRNKDKARMMHQTPVKNKMHCNGQRCKDKTTPKQQGPAMAFPGPQWYHTDTHFLKGMAALED